MRVGSFVPGPPLDHVTWPPPGAISAGLIDAASNVGPSCARHAAGSAAKIQICVTAAKTQIPPARYGEFHFGSLGLTKVSILEFKVTDFSLAVKDIAPLDVGRVGVPSDRRDFRKLPRTTPWQTGAQPIFLINNRR